MVVGDHVVLKELLAHLFDNAVRYTQKGEVRLTASVVERVGDHVRLAFSVEDTGPGIDPKILPALATPFKYGALNGGRSEMFSEDGTVGAAANDLPNIFDGKFHGTSGSGLGIPIATHLARLFKGGDLVISSESNSGTACTFTALFPYQTQPGATSVTKIPVPTLCVCGPRFQVGSMSRLLQREGFQSVASVGSSADAISYLTTASPPVEFVVLYDWTKPTDEAFNRNKNVEVAERIRALRLEVQPKICLVGAAENRSPSDSVVPKPLRMRALRQVVVRLFSDSYALTDGIKGPGLVEKTKMIQQASDFVKTANDVTDEDLAKFKLRILVAEDDRVNARVISASVRKLGHECHITGDGKTCALEFQKDPSRPYDIVFMDLYMPGMNGIDSTKEIREYEARMGLPLTTIIGVTGEDRHAEQRQMLSAGMDDIILKPVTGNGLKGFLRRAQLKKFHDTQPRPESAVGLNSGRSSVSSSSDESPDAYVSDRKRILVAEDNDFTAKVTIQVLKSNGWEADRARDGRDAFEMLTTSYEKYSLVLMDIQMPVVDGLSCTKQIREWERAHSITPAIKILALTGVGEDSAQRRNECQIHGCDDFLPKPISYPKLVPHLQSMLNL